MNEIDKFAAKIIKNITTKQLCEMFEETESMEVTQEVADARGWIAAELERRNPEAYEEWIWTEDKPSLYFLN